MEGVTSETGLLNPLADKQIQEALQQPPQEQSEVVIFPYKGHNENGTATGYVFERSVADAIGKAFPNANIVVSHKPSHREHRHYTSDGPELAYLSSMGPLARCEKRIFKLS